MVQASGLELVNLLYLMIAETISLGILELPEALSTLGPLPGITAIVGVGLISIYTGYTIGQLKQRFMQIHSMADAGDLLMGKLGSRVLGASQLLFFIFVMGSHVLTFSTMMNVLTEHSNCTALFAYLGVLISFTLTLPRRLDRLSHLSTISFISIFGAVVVSMVGISWNWDSLRLSAFSPTPTVHEACLAIASMVFAYAGHVVFFTLFSELRDIRDFPKALALLQTCEMSLYTLSATVIYAYVGNEVTSPVFNSAGKLFCKISFGIAPPTIVIGVVVNAHVAVKFIYVRLFCGTTAMHARSVRARTTLAVCASLWILSWIIAEGIPVFNDVLGLASSLFASWFSFGLPGMFWLYLNRSTWFLTRKQITLFLVNFSLLLLAVIICVIGLYSSIVSIYQNLREGVGGERFSCADNSVY